MAQIQTHRRLGKYPALACSEPYGVLGQWILVQGDVKNSQDIFAEAQAMMLPADLATEAIAEALDTPRISSLSFNRCRCGERRRGERINMPPPAA